MADDEKTLLTDDQVEEALAGLPAWSRRGDEIVREATAPSFLEGIAVVVDVARAAEDADHHPDIDIRWRTLSFALSTHSEGGLTAKDFTLARRIDEAVAAHS